MKQPHPSVEIHIRELVVEGVSWREAARIGAAIERELARRFAGPSEPYRPAHPAHPVQIEIPARGDVAGAVGRSVAAAVHRTSAGLSAVPFRGKGGRP
jgi:hypothetical protein